MGTDVHVVVVASRELLGPLLAASRARIDELEARWSRFRDDSEISVLNRSPGRPVLVSEDTFRLVVTMVAAFELTGGACDATVLDAVVAAGYDRDFRAVARDRSATAPVTAGSVHGVAGSVHGVAGSVHGMAGSVPGMTAVGIDAVARTVTLPEGTHLDPGGIGKGLAADMVARELRAAGASGLCVNAGGDLRVSGTPPAGDAWVVDVEPAAADGPPTGVRLAVVDGAVATTSRLRRVWSRDGAGAHHVIDPRTGRPAETPFAAATVVAGEGWRAEALAKAALLAGTPERAGAVLVSNAATGLLLLGDGGVVALPGLDPYVVSVP